MAFKFRKKKKNKNKQEEILEPVLQQEPEPIEKEENDEEITEVVDDVIQIKKPVFMQAKDQVKKEDIVNVAVNEDQEKTVTKFPLDTFEIPEEFDEDALEDTVQFEPIEAVKIPQNPAEEMEAFYQSQKESGMHDMRFYENGKQAYGEKIVNGFHYYFDPLNDGKFASGLVNVNPNLALDGQKKTVYCSMYGNFLFGQYEIDGRKYYFLPESGKMAKSQVVIDGEDEYYYDAFGNMFKGIIKLDGGIKYFDLETGKMAKGLTVIPASLNYGQEKKVLFDEGGNMVFGLLEREEGIQCFDLKTGAMFTGLVNLSSEYGGPKTVYFDENGMMIKGLAEVNSKKMYFSKTGKLITNSMIRIGEDTYYFDQKGYMFHGPKYLSGNWKYFDDETGAMLTGLVKIKDEDHPEGFKTVYYDEDGNMVFSQQKINGKWKCFDLYDGHMFTGLHYLSPEYGGPKTVYYDENGDMVYGSVFLNGKYMYFDESGEMVCSSIVEIDGDKYYYNDAGWRQYGQKYINSKWKYFDIDTGIMRTGLVELDERAEGRGAKTALYDEEGNMMFGEQIVDGNYKYFDLWDGHMVTGMIYIQDEINGSKTCYYDESGNRVYGERVINGHEMFFSNDGSMVRNTLVDLDDEIYFYDQNGYKYKGQIKINGSWKYFDIQTGAMQYGLQHLDLQVEPSGEKTVYYDENGDMVFGLREIDGQIKCFDLVTGDMKKGLVHLSKDYGEEKTVYFDENGSMVFGSYELEGKTYEFDEKTGALKRIPPMEREWIVNENDPLETMKNNALIIWGILKDQKWSMEAVSGMLANMEMLSGITPEKEEEDRYGLLLLPKSENVESWMENNGLDPKQGSAQISRILFEKENNLHWNRSEDYPISFKEYSVIEFKPSYAALTFRTNYLNNRLSDPEKLSDMAEAWYNYLQENEF